MKSKCAFSKCDNNCYRHFDFCQKHIVSYCVALNDIRNDLSKQKNNGEKCSKCSNLCVGKLGVCEEHFEIIKSISKEIVNFL